MDDKDIFDNSKDKPETLSDALSAYRNLTSRFSDSGKRSASRETGVELPLSDILKLIPDRYLEKNRGDIAGKTVFVQIPDLLGQLRKGKVTLNMQELTACVPAAMLLPQAFEDQSVVSLPLASVVGAMDSTFMEQQSAGHEKEYDLSSLPDPFRKAEAVAQVVEPEPIPPSIVPETPPIPEEPLAPMRPPVLESVPEPVPPPVPVPPPLPPVPEKPAEPAMAPAIPVHPAVVPVSIAEIPAEPAVTIPPIPQIPPIPEPELEPVEAKVPAAPESPPLPSIEEIEHETTPLMQTTPVIEPIVVPPPLPPEEKVVVVRPKKKAPEYVEEPEEPETEEFAPPAGVNVNSATADQMIAIEGLSLNVAKKIVEYRESHGAFKSIFSICDVSGVNKNLFRVITGMPYSGKSHHRGHKLAKILRIPIKKICHVPSIAEAVGKMSGISGCVISDKEGLVIAANEAGPLAEAIGAVAHEIVSHMQRSMEMAGNQDVDSVSISIKGQMFTVICSGEIYVTVVHDSNRITGAKLAQIQSIASELEWVLSRRLYIGT